MLDFMIIGLPRSATTWAANWLCTDRTHCVHDPLDRLHYSEWDEKLSKPGKLSGVSCTSIWRFPDFINAHPAKKLVLCRSPLAVNRSLAAIGLPPVEGDLRDIKGMHVLYSDIFLPAIAKQIWNYLTGDRFPFPFDEERHAELVRMVITPEFRRSVVDRSLVRRLVEEVQAAVK